MAVHRHFIAAIFTLYSTGETLMSAAKELLRHLIERSHGIIRAYVEDLTDAELLVRSVSGSNHIAWQLGHIIGGVQKMLGGLGQPAFALPDGFLAAHGKEMAACDDPAKFASIAEYLALLDQAKAASLAAVEAIPESDFGRPGPESMRQYAPTIGVVLMLLGTHGLMHAGQFVPIRRKLGKPAKF
jgi:nucleotide-binding universal stress UspA family protein